MTWVETDSLSFTARHDSGDATFAERTLDRMEELRLRLEERFAVVPGDVTVVVHTNPLLLSLAHPFLPAARWSEGWPATSPQEAAVREPRPSGAIARLVRPRKPTRSHPNSKSHPSGEQLPLPESDTGPHQAAGAENGDGHGNSNGRSNGNGNGRSNGRATPSPRRARHRPPPV